MGVQMSETETGGEEPGTEPEDADNPGVPEVLDALAPLTEQMDTLSGFAVKHGRLSEPGKPRDPDVVEVRVTLAPPRHPRDVDRAMGMLQGNGFRVRKVLRGGQSTVRSVLRVWVGGGEPPTERRGGREQATF